MTVSPEYRVPIVAAAEDIDELGHVSNLVWLRYVQTAAWEHSSHVGFDYAAYVKIGAVFVVRRHEIDYLGPAFAGDELVATTWIASWGAATSERMTRITRAGSDRDLLRAKTLWAFVSVDSGRPRRIPPEVGNAFALSPPAA